jgi:selenocysteine-specific elongation factor
MAPGTRPLENGEIMSVERINITIGTAGHIDHGKTALVKLLTGCDTDRLKAEKERGISIDLGFAPCKLLDTEIGIVDVPGHENFIKTMVAGACGMDGVILVVAADDGVMPQTREHFDILTLLGIKHGLVALTKIDRVEPDQVELARDETADFLRGTFLDGAAICPISSVTGQGFDGFFEALSKLLAGIRPKPVDGVFRVPVDRAFSAPGFGTVVAGIPVSGQARVGDDLVLLPQGDSGRIRQIEVYGQASETVMAGQCAAINIGHWQQRTIRRGDTVAVPGCFAPYEWYACKLRLLCQEKLLLKSGTQVKFHTGTSEVTASVYSMQEDRLAAGGEYLVQIRTNSPVVAGPGDHFILRTLSPVRTVGGGTIIEGLDGRLKRNRPQVVEDLRQRAEAVADESRFVEYCIRKAPLLAAGEEELAVRAKVPRGRLSRILAELMGRKVVAALTPSLYVHRDTAAEASARLIELVAQFHRESPESPGIPLEQLRTSAGMDRSVLRGLVGQLLGDGRLVERDGRLAAGEHRATFGDEDAQRIEAIEALFRRHEFRPPGTEEIADKIGVPAKEVTRLVGILREHRRLVPVAQGLLFHAEAVDRARQILLDHMEKNGKVESVDFKYLLDTTRKFAIPMLDYLDRLGITRRVGNTRYPKPQSGGKPKA